MAHRHLPPILATPRLLVFDVYMATALVVGVGFLVAALDLARLNAYPRLSAAPEASATVLAASLLSRERPLLGSHETPTSCRRGATSTRTVGTRRRLRTLVPE